MQFVSCSNAKALAQPEHPSCLQFHSGELPFLNGSSPVLNAGKPYPFHSETLVGLVFWFLIFWVCWRWLDYCACDSTAARADGNAAC